MRNGLSLQDQSAHLTSGTEFALLIVNSTNAPLSIHPGVAIITLTVDARPHEPTVDILWACPKCKHGGKDREHTKEKGCRYQPGRAAAKATAPQPAPPVPKAVPAGLAPASTDPPPLVEQDNGILEPTAPGPIRDQNHALPPVDRNHAPAKPAAAPQPPTKEAKIREAYKRLKMMKFTDITLNLHEQLKNMDASWVKR